MINGIAPIVSTALTDSVFDIARLLKRNPKYRKPIMIVSLIVFLLSVIMVYVTIGYWNSNDKLMVIFVIVSGSSLLFLLNAILSLFIDDTKTVNDLLADLSNERNEIIGKSKDNLGVFDIVRLNLNQLNEYYTINKIQAKGSYKFSVFTISFGSLLIMFGIIYAVIINEFGLINILSTAAGAIAEFIGATSLLLYKESNKNVNNFFAQLTYLQKVMLAIELTNGLSDENRKTEIGNIIASLINNENTNIA